ncbi:unnamed protein product [Fusarium graminearum]|uniref:Uncharacterized protein n=1 Tax=Gibberella zeae TaxID=5518 RepID=A0A4E9DY26_GIBZA|nr:unnamed protein product [Fusarium graminearum]CAF3443869.1 unnamed protein product [Fusarium graminearum]
MVQMTGLQGTVRTVSVGSAAGLMTAIADCKGGLDLEIDVLDSSVRNVSLRYVSSKWGPIVEKEKRNSQMWRAGTPLSLQGNTGA